MGEADLHVPVHLNAVRWVLAATLLFWLAVVYFGYQFLSSGAS